MNQQDLETKTSSFEVDDHTQFEPSAPDAASDLHHDDTFAMSDGEEVCSMRGENTKQYDLGENRYQAVVYSEPVHYRSGGEWEEIDNTLEEVEADGRKIFRNRANAMLCELPSIEDPADWGQ